jgi:hypothetical protein
MFTAYWWAKSKPEIEENIRYLKLALAKLMVFLVTKLQL